MKQAKLRVEGQVLTRNDTVLVMMEEAITKAKGVIEERFLQIEKKEEFAGTSILSISKFFIVIIIV